MLSKVLQIIFAVIFFFALPFGGYLTASSFTDQYFRLKGIPYPSETFATLVGAGVSCWIVGLSFFIHGILFQKKGDSR